MKLLLDTCVWGGAKVELAAEGHDVVRWHLPQALVGLLAGDNVGKRMVRVS